MNLFSKKDNVEEENTNTELTTELSRDKEIKKSNPFLEIIHFSLIALLIVVPIRMFIAQPFIVSGASMEETFHTGEYLIVDQVSYYLHEPTRGDVVVFHYPNDPSKYFIKRIIGLPNETISINGSTVTIINEEKPKGFVLDEPYIKSMNKETQLEEKLGPTEYFVMGDNRDQSSDSRTWGALQEEEIIGKAFLRLFPPSSLGVMPGSIKQITSD